MQSTSRPKTKKIERELITFSETHERLQSPIRDKTRGRDIRQSNRRGEEWRDAKRIAVTTARDTPTRENTAMRTQTIRLQEREQREQEEETEQNEPESGPFIALPPPVSHQRPGTKHEILSVILRCASAFYPCAKISIISSGNDVVSYSPNVSRSPDVRCRTSMAVMGHKNLSVILAETRWPSSGIDSGEVDATLLYRWWWRGKKKIGGGFGWVLGGGGDALFVGVNER
ncbi:Uncharacterized protein Rs2_05579 [Raphanus sativus]|nr:Uncharacterized protein Rs2_05579 [Raphanus sativus]